MRINRNDVPTRIDAPGAVVRVQPGFGEAAGMLGAEYLTLGAGTDITPLLHGLTDDTCHAAHWGHIVNGELIVTYLDGATDRCVTGDLFYWPPGHTVRVVQDSEVVMFSPVEAHAEVLDHMLAKMAG